VKVVSAFNRTSTGTASISTIDIKVEEVKLYDGGTTANLKSDGILDRTTNIYASAAAQTAYTNAYNTAKAAASNNTDADAHTAGGTAGTAAITAATAGTPDKDATVVNYSVSNLDVTGANVSDAVITSMVKRVDDVIGQMTTAATKLGAAKSRIDLQKTFTSSLMDSIDRGVGQLVDADMNKESTRLQALQVQQQLGIQALSIANGNSQSILSLFR
jgi:flagellin